MLTVVLCRMTLGTVYDLDLKKNESLIKEVIVQAQGEVCGVSALVARDAKYALHRWLWRSTLDRSRKSGLTIHSIW